MTEFNDGDAGGVPDGVYAANWGKVVSRHRAAKSWGTRGVTAVSVGIQAAQLGTGTGMLALATGAAAVSATGIGLIAAGGAATLTSMGLGIRSAVSTSKVLGTLKDLHQKRASFPCHVLTQDPKHQFHILVSDMILPWIIRQKKHKLGKKIASSAAAGLAVGLWSAGRKAYKAWKGTLGRDRHWYANALAVHLLTAECALTNAIVAALYSPDEMLWMKQQDSDTITPLLEDKMKSI